MFHTLKHGSILEKVAAETEQEILHVHQQIDQKSELNEWRVLENYRKHKVSDTHFNLTTGYGYDDMGRDTLEKIYADVFGGESGLVRPQIISGTHAISIALFGVLRPGDELIYMTGKPYDTLEEIVGIRGKEGTGSLKDFQIDYKAIDLRQDGSVDYEKVKESISSKTKVIGIQRSKGYASRPSFTIEEIEQMISFVKEMNEEIIVFVDNCYGEFTELKSHVMSELTSWPVHSLKTQAEALPKQAATSLEKKNG